MIPLYVICWRNFNIAEACLESIIETASEELEITVVSPNDKLPNSGTAQIRSYLQELACQNKIKRALFFEENVFGWGLMKAIEDFPPQSPLFFCTDGDLILPENVDWVGLSKKYHEDHWVVTGCNLSTENYLPPNHGFSKEDENFGMWLQCLKTDWFWHFHGTQQNSIDSRIMDIARFTGGATKIREIEAIHTTWEIHDPNSPYYDPEYSQYKKERASGWVFDSRPDNMNYTLVEKTDIV